MSVKIRMQSKGKSGQRSFRIVVIDERKSQPSETLDQVGFYDPMAEGAERIRFDEERLKKWLVQGAQFTDSARRELVKAGFRVPAGAPQKAATKVTPHAKKKYNAVAKRVKTEKKAKVLPAPKKKKKDAKKA